jgi:hypothetical protein
MKQHGLGSAPSPREIAQLAHALESLRWPLQLGDGQNEAISSTECPVV